MNSEYAISASIGRVTVGRVYFNWPVGGLITINCPVGLLCSTREPVVTVY